jgi:hypothetical protein
MQRGHAQRGAVLPLIAICLAVLMGFAGLSVDVGFLEYKQQAQQLATDAAAIGGAEAAYADGCQSGTVAYNAAIADAALNGYSSSMVTPNSPPTSGPYSGNACAVSVSITNPGVQTFFSKVLTGVGSMKETTQAVGLASQNNAGCIWLLTTSQQSDLSNSHITTPGCSIYINDSANMSNATINAAYIGYAGSTSNNTSGTTFTNATPAPMSQVSDPCPQMPGCAYLTNNTPSCSSFASGNFTGGANIGSAGVTTCFSNLKISGSSNTVCGLIVVGAAGGSQLQMSGGTTSVSTCASGVTFQMLSSVSTINFSSATLTFTAPTTGNTRGVVLWRNSAQSSAVNISSGTYAFSGLLYFPTAQVNYSSASGSYANLVFGQGNFSTSAGLNLGSPPPNGTIALKATLAE